VESPLGEPWDLGPEAGVLEDPMKTQSIATLLIAILLGAVGCSSQPSQGDINSAAKQLTDQSKGQPHFNDAGMTGATGGGGGGGAETAKKPHH